MVNCNDDVSEIQSGEISRTSLIIEIRFTTAHLISHFHSSGTFNLAPCLRRRFYQVLHVIFNQDSCMTHTVCLILEVFPIELFRRTPESENFRRLEDYSISKIEPDRK